MKCGGRGWREYSLQSGAMQALMARRTDNDTMALTRRQHVIVLGLWSLENI
jgi:hypothetical protein